MTTQPIARQIQHDIIKDSMELFIDHRSGNVQISCSTVSGECLILNTDHVTMSHICTEFITRAPTFVGTRKLVEQLAER